MFGVGLFGKSFSHLRILNIYNLWTKRTSQMTVSALVAFLDLPHPTLVVGDFNIHHPLPDPLRSLSTEELATSFQYCSKASEPGLASSINLAFTLISPLTALAALLLLIFPLRPPRCFPFAKHGTPPSPPLALITSLSRSYSQTRFLLPLVLPPIGP